MTAPQGYTADPLTTNEKIEEIFFYDIASNLLKEILQPQRQLYKQKLRDEE